MIELDWTIHGEVYKVFIKENVDAIPRVMPIVSSLVSSNGCDAEAGGGAKPES